MSVTIDMTDRIALVTGASGALGSAVAAAFSAVGATTVATDVVPIDDDGSLLDADRVAAFYEIDFTDADAVEAGIADIVKAHDGIDYLASIAGTWMGGDPVEDTATGTADALYEINLKTLFLASKFALPHLQESEGAIVSVSARSSLEGGSGDAMYRATKAGVRLLTESIAEENSGTVRANAIMPSVIDTPMNREMMSSANYDRWVDPADIAQVILWLCSDEAGVTSGAAVPVYGEA